MNNTYTAKLDVKIEPVLKKELESKGFVFQGVVHAFWRAQKNNLTATFYNSGKLLLQGKDIDKFLDEMQTCGYFEGHCLPDLQKKDKLASQPDENKWKSWIGTDESGKGDYFGPLVIAGVLVDENNIKILSEFNIQDSKKMKDSLIEKVAAQIKANSIHSVVIINPAKYNELYLKFKNLNSLLAWGHARAIENILEKKPCQNALSDKFGNESLILNALMQKGRTINLVQRTKAESDLAVAAASILARNEFVQRMNKLSNEYGIDFQKGASEKVKAQACSFISKFGRDALKNLAKLHFKTTNELSVK